jgi:hypothetical protein
MCTKNGKAKLGMENAICKVSCARTAPGTFIDRPIAPAAAVPLNNMRRFTGFCAIDVNDLVM